MGFDGITQLFKNPNLTPATTGLLGKLGETSAQSAQYQGEAAIDTANAGIAKINAGAATLQGEREAETYGNAFRTAYGQKAEGFAGGGASGGVDATKGSAFSSLMDFTKGGALDQATIRNNAANKAFGFTEQANQDTFAAQVAQQQAGASIGSGLLTGGLQFLNTLKGKS
jgi:hypothetical protein